MGSPWVVLAFSVTLTLAMCVALWAYVQRRDARRFHLGAHESAERFRTRLSVCASMLQGAAGLLSAAPEVTRARFHAYVEVLDASRAYFGVQDIGYAVRAPGALSVLYLEPLDLQNRKVLGFDIFSDSVRREAAERARDTGRPVVSGKVKLLRDGGASAAEAGFLLWVPVYRGGLAPGSVKERQEALQGFVFAAFHPRDLMHGVFGREQSPAVDVALYDGPEVSPDRLLYASTPPGRQPSSSGFLAVEHMEVAGRDWTFAVQPRAAFEPESGTSLVLVVLFGGLLLSGGVFAFARAQDRARRALERSNAHLRQSEQALVQESRITATLLRISSRFGSELEEAKLVQSITDEAVALTGAQFGAFFHKVVNEGGQGMLLYTLAGAPREAFSKFPLPRPTSLFGITFRGERIVRLADVLADPLYGRSAPYHGMPPGHPAVRSYLAVPVTSRSGEVLGGLFFGHAEPGVFTAEHERLMAGVAAQAAVALDNARLFKEAQEAIQLRDEFMSIASHELRTPLTPLKLQLDTLQRSLRSEALAPVAEAFAPKLQSAARQAERLTALVESLLDVSRLRRGALEVQRQPVNLGTLVKDVLERFSYLLEAAGCQVELQVEEGVVGAWDPLRIEQVVTNLLTNALKYGAGRPIGVRVRSEGGLAVLSVTDRGIGIAPADLERIFQRFERAVASTSYGGLGLGLFITRRIVEVHQGRVWATSELGQGATFTVELPKDARVT